MDKLSAKEYEDPLRVASSTNALLRAVTSQEQSGLNVVKASVFRRWLVTAPYRGEQTTRLTGGHDFLASFEKISCQGIKG